MSACVITNTVQLASKFTARIGKNAYLARFFARRIVMVCVHVTIA